MWEEKGAGENLSILCELLKGNTIPAKKLCLSGAMVGEPGARMISEALKYNTALTELELGSDETIIIQWIIESVEHKNEMN